MPRLTVWHLAILPMIMAEPAVAASPPLQEAVAREAAVLANMHRKASSALVNVAQDPAFAAIFAATDAPGRARLKDRIDQISLRTQANFQVGEMCLIGADGAERSRIVGREVATDLDMDETHNEFFASTLKSKPRSVYIPKIYLSDDTKAWVVAYATPIALNGANVGLLHYEHRLDEYQRELEDASKAADMRLMAVDEAGRVIVDTVDEPPTSAKTDQVESAYFKPFSLAGSDIGALRARLGGAGAGHGQVEAGAAALDVAYQQVQGWTLVGTRAAGASLADGHTRVQDR